MTEVEISKVAEKSANPEVKHFAERTVQDHSAANTELTSIATGLGIEMPNTLSSEHQRIPEPPEEHARQGLRPAIYAPDGR
jgi:putative membrane protein